MSDLASRVSREALVSSLEDLTGRKDVQLLDDYQVKRASSAVEGFTSLVLRVNVSYRLPGDDQTHSYVFIVKSMPQTKYQREFVTTGGLFSKEWLVFSKVSPLMTNVSAGRVEVPLPACYHAVCDGDDSAFYMEDLVAAGYRAVNRSCLTHGLDHAHCSVVMKTLGRFHALSMTAEKTLKPGSGGWAGSFPEFDVESVYCFSGPDEPPSTAQVMFDNLLQNIKDMCGEMDGFPKVAVASGALDKVLRGVYTTLTRLNKTPPSNRRVLTHGDCWMNNMMFRYKKEDNGSEKPTEVKFFDLQVAKCRHPCVDLLYFMYQSTRRSLREKYIISLIEEYYESLTETLTVLDGGPPPFSLEELTGDTMGEYKPYGIIFGILYSPLQMLGDEFLLSNAEELTEEKIQELLNSESTQNIKQRFNHDPKYRSYIEELVREFLDMALPNGVESVESSPLLAKAVN